MHRVLVLACSVKELHVEACARLAGSTKLTRDEMRGGAPLPQRVVARWRAHCRVFVACVSRLPVFSAYQTELMIERWTLVCVMRETQRNHHLDEKVLVM